MSDSAPRPKRLFNRDTVGVKTSPVMVDIERGQVDFFVRTIGETDPIHRSRFAAETAGHPDIVAPVTFPIVISMRANAILESQGRQPLFELIEADFSRLLHGEERYDYQGLIYVGDRVSVQSEVCGFDDKKNGAMELATLQTVISHIDRGPLVTMTSSAIHRLV
jgi:acyl dehydratase